MWTPYRQSPTWLNAPAVVYLCRDTNGHLIYIGHTTDLYKRIKAHKSTTPWWAEVAAVSSSSSRPLHKARKDEARLIARHRPRYNKRLNPDWYAAGKPVEVAS